MDWNRNACWIAGLGIDMMAAVDALQFPAMPFQVESPARPVLHPMTGLRRWLRIPDRVQPGVGSPGTRGSDSTRLSRAFIGGYLAHEAAAGMVVPSERYIDTGECFSSSPPCDTALNSTAPGQRAVRRPRMAPRGDKNRGLSLSRRPLPPLGAYGGVIPPPTPAGGPPGQTPGTCGSF